MDRSLDDLFELPVDEGVLGEDPGAAPAVEGDTFVDIAGWDHGLAKETMPQQGADAEDIGGAGESAGAQLFGGGVARCAEEDRSARGAAVVLLFLIDELGDAEVQDFHLLITLKGVSEHDICRF